MFALRAAPPSRLNVADADYHLVRVFKHDFLAATCLYETDDHATFPKIAVKFGRDHMFCVMPCKWYGRWLQAHEEAIYRTLAGIQGVPRWVGRVGETGYAMEYIESKPLDHFDKAPAGFFERLRKLFDAVHSRGVAYCDSNKRSNILVAADGRPYLVDYQIALRRRDDWPLRNMLHAFIRYMAEKDIYHLCKHKRRMSPGELAPEEISMSRQRTPMHRLLRKLDKPYKALRRGFLRRKCRKGQLVSPTGHLEDHFQPEKANWRTGRDNMP